MLELRHYIYLVQLAMAGLGFRSLQPTPSAQCQICLTVLDDLQPDSNPWQLHLEKNPDCFFINLGPRDEVDDYTMDQLLEMAFNKFYSIGVSRPHKS